MNLRVAIATRIFDPEPSAASFRLQALALELTRRGYDTTVLTVRAPKALRRGARQGAETRGAGKRGLGYHVSRFPVLRDRTGYVRGYLQYLSFDVPLFFRILLGRRRDAIVVEPPPTTWLFAGVAAKLRRTTLFTYAADVWSDASDSTGAPAIIVRAVRGFERWAWKSSAGVFAVNEGVASRVREICPTASVHVVGNGVDTHVFTLDGPAHEQTHAEHSGSEPHTPYLIYTGTASEWQGAEVYIHAVHQLASEGEAVRLVFLGQGTAIPTLKQLAATLGAPVEFVDTVPPEKATMWIRGASAGLASIRPGVGYDFAFPTKLYAAWATGTPTVYAGPGPVRKVLGEMPVLGIGVGYETDEVASAIRTLLSRDLATDAPEIAAWARAHVSLDSVAARVVDEVERVVRHV